MGEVTPLPPPTTWWMTFLKGALFRRLAAGIIGMVAIACCGLLPPAASTLCSRIVTFVQSAIATAPSSPELAPLQQLQPAAPALDTRPRCPPELCLSTGYALPMPDGGSCRCR